MMVDVLQSAAMTAAMLQTGDIDVTIDPTVGLLGGAVGAFLTTLMVGGVMVAVFPEYVERMMAAVLDDPIGSFVYGIICLACLALAIVVLVLTIIGVVVAVPLALAAYLVWAIGATIGYLAIAERLVGREDGWLKPLLVGAAINGVLALTGIGGIIAVAIGAAGFGVVLQSWIG